MHLPLDSLEGYSYWSLECSSVFAWSAAQGARLPCFLTEKDFVPPETSHDC
jgi:hypothetical protein